MSKLNIESIETADGKSLKFNIGEEVPNFGSKFTVTLNEAANYGDKLVLVLLAIVIFIITSILLY